MRFLQMPRIACETSQFFGWSSTRGMLNFASNYIFSQLGLAKQ
jgi:hypothetical protein